MRIFIPTKGRSKTIRTHKVFEGCDYFVIVHNYGEYLAYRDESTVPENRLLVSGVKADAYGLTRQREWVVDNLVAPDEWFIFADDNIRAITSVPLPHFNNLEQDFPNDKYDTVWSARYRRKCPISEFMEIARLMVIRATRLGIHLCGFSAVDNYFFRRNHWRTVGYIIGKLMIMHNHNLEFDHTITMEDFNQTARQLLLYGQVLINCYTRPHAGHYEAGGMGKYEERIPYRLRDCQLLMERYSGLFRLKKLKHMVHGTDLALRIYSEKQIALWRESMRALGCVAPVEKEPIDNV